MLFAWHIITAACARSSTAGSNCIENNLICNSLWVYDASSQPNCEHLEKGCSQAHIVILFHAARTDMITDVLPQCSVLNPNAFF